MFTPLRPSLFDHLQYANMDWEAWEIWSRAMTSGRHMGRGMNDLKTLSCNVDLRPGVQSIHEAASLFVVNDARDRFIKSASRRS